MLGACWLELASPTARAELWRTGYFPGYHQSYLPASQIDFQAITHVIHFSVMPNGDGTLDAAINGLTPGYMADLIAQAHRAGRKALICVGGAGSQAGFQGATTRANLTGFVQRLADFLSAHGYDGVDLDWEPLVESDHEQFGNLVGALRDALNRLDPQLLLTVATASEPELFSALQGQFDQINLMTYDLAGPWPGWVTWFNAPIFDGGYRFPSTGGLVPSSDGIVQGFIAAGVKPEKLALGMAFYGMIWTHGTGTATGGICLPRQTWKRAPTATASAYYQIMASYYAAERYHWDAAAQAAYLSITNANATNDLFLSYDDEHACQAKVSYARNHQLGGVMMWELSQGYQAANPGGRRHPLLQAIRDALATPGPLVIARTNQTLRLSFPSAPLGWYRILWSDDLAGDTWRTLTNDVPGVMGDITVIDSVAATESRRFYRVQTPP
jgi:chitinase